MKKLTRIIISILMAALLLSSCSVKINNASTTEGEKSTAPYAGSITNEKTAQSTSTSELTFDLSNIPEYSGKAYVQINNNQPDFKQSDMTTKSYEQYGKLDYYHRCTACIANIGRDLMPTEKRGSISSVHPTGWKSVTYKNVDGGSLYNRCHLIGFQLTGENANERNLITGTRYMNTEGMLPFEEKTASYIKSTNNHVLYRVTPIFKDKELVARGVQMEAISVEDNGKGVKFNVYCYNVQPGIEINYATGDSKLISESTQAQQETKQSERGTYFLNTKSKRFHRPDCSAVESMNPDNKKRFSGSRQSLIDQGYKPCGSCNP